MLRAFLSLLSPEPDRLFGASRSGQWPRVRAHHLFMEPTCQACGTRSDLEVHHVIPVHLDPAGELVPSNLISLCRPHHFLYGHGLDWRSAVFNVREHCARTRLMIRERRYALDGLCLFNAG